MTEPVRNPEDVAADTPSGRQSTPNAPAVAAELRFIADWLDDNCADADLYASLSLGPRTDQAPERDRVALVDWIGLGLTGEVGSVNSDYSHIYALHGQSGPLYISAQTTVAPPVKRKMEEELARLRAEIDAARRERDAEYHAGSDDPDALG